MPSLRWIFFYLVVFLIQMSGLKGDSAPSTDCLDGAYHSPIGEEAKHEETIPITQWDDEYSLHAVPLPDPTMYKKRFYLRGRTRPPNIG